MLGSTTTLRHHQFTPTHHSSPTKPSISAHNGFSVQYCENRAPAPLALLTTMTVISMHEIHTTATQASGQPTVTGDADTPVMDTNVRCAEPGQMDCDDTSMQSLHEHHGSGAYPGTGDSHSVTLTALPTQLRMPRSLLTTSRRMASVSRSLLATKWLGLTETTPNAP